MEISSNAVRLEMGLRFLTKVPDIFKEIRFNMFSNAVNSAISVFCRLSFLRFVSVDNGMMSETGFPLKEISSSKVLNCKGVKS